MNGMGYIGHAGTGKTTLLIKDVEKSIDPATWPKHSSILAITFMHGSRKRLEEKLKEIQKIGVHVTCQTIDSFCVNVVRRYKSYINISKSLIVSDNIDEYAEIDDRIVVGLNQIREMAIRILNLQIVKDIINFSYPIVVVDEFQDCEGDLLQIIKILSECSNLFVAADDFQKLDNSFDCPATQWMESELTLNKLNSIWRTDNSKILDSAKSLRSNTPTHNGVEVRYVESKNLAAFIILSSIQWGDKMGGNGRSVAILSPVGPQSDSFVKQTLERIQDSMEGKKTKSKSGYKLFPCPFYLEKETRTTAQDVLNENLDGWQSSSQISKEELGRLPIDKHIGLRIGVTRAERIMKLRNIESLSSSEFTNLVSSGIHFADTHLQPKKETRVFLTIHGAKNREFDDVFVLWPKYTLPSEDLYLRKLMYNAITRAKRKVIVIVQGKSNRNQECPLNLISP